MSREQVDQWWASLDDWEQEDVESWWKDSSKPFPDSAGQKQVGALLVSPGSYVNEMTVDVEEFLAGRFGPRRD